MIQIGRRHNANPRTCLDKLVARGDKEPETPPSKRLQVGEKKYTRKQSARKGASLKDYPTDQGSRISLDGNPPEKRYNHSGEA